MQYGRLVGAEPQAVSVIVRKSVLGSHTLVYLLFSESQLSSVLQNLKGLTHISYEELVVTVLIALGFRGVLVGINTDVNKVPDTLVDGIISVGILVSGIPQSIPSVAVM